MAAEKVRAENGADARAPSEFGWVAWKQVLSRVWDRIAVDHLSIVAAGVAFFGALAIFPSIAALIGIYGLFSDPVAVAYNLEAVRPMLPPDAYSLIEGQVNDLVAAGTQLGVASSIAFLIALWSARAGVMALIEGLNIVYRETDGRGFFMSYLWSLLVTVLMILVGVVAILAVVAIPAALLFIDATGAEGAWIARVAPVLILGLAVIFVIGGLYRYGPDRSHARKRWISPGAILATLLWIVASLLLSFYISRFANFNQTYGSLGALAGLLFWLYVSAFVVLLGAELNAEMELQTACDTTTGPPRPMGERGAFVADHVAGPDGEEPEPDAARPEAQAEARPGDARGAQGSAADAHPRARGAFAASPGGEGTRASRLRS